ncbi:MO25-like protein [Hibiscus syriacus]|uniref:MO25-like protein n=1 Tax=Hibiscus syriacus TaxID=106335 RepID=A0A6A2WLL5_HIBSY|nr:putative MO25-like protein At5g47540 [Hibiscus syriacus]KAE8660763.1 MO25-like protein [Hibiscus syriacus]
MKGLFKAKPRTPVEMVQYLHELLLFVHGNTETREKKRAEKIAELDKLLLDIRTVLFGDGQIEPNAESCAQLTKEFFQKDTFRLLISCLPSLDSGARQNVIHVIANLQRQKVNSKVIASEYLGNNLDIMDTLLPGYEDGDIAWTYGSILRECIRHQNVARYVLESDHMKKFFQYLQNPNFDIASDVQATFKELLTRHKSTVAEFLSANYDWFFHEYNTKLLQSESYITRRHAVKLLGDMLLDRSNSAVMVRYVTSLEHMRIMMNLLRDSNKTIKLDTFHVFKLFVANQNKPPEILSVLVTNRSKLLRFFGEFNIDKEDDQFEADKSQIIKEIATLQQPADRSCHDLESF